MAQPTTREEFKQWCLRKLGAPVIEINVDDDQIDNRIDEALSYYWDYHFDGTERIYYKHVVTEDDVTNKYLTIPENIIGAIRVFPLSGADVSHSYDYMYDVKYQIIVNELYAQTYTSMIPLYISREHLSLIDEMLVGQVPIRYSRHRNRLYVDTKWANVITAGRIVVIEAYEIVDPDLFADVWKDRWLQNYCTALIQQQWGRHLTKFTGMTLPGGIQFNGERILTDATNEIEKMENEMISKYSAPLMDFVA